MNTKFMWKKLHFDCIPSTSDYVKTLRSKRENVVVIADAQTGGRGTKGRSFSSKKGGLYLSALTFYQNLSAGEAFLIMAGAATSVCKTLEAFGIKSKIKWPNDIYVNDKKICGILIENTFSGKLVDNSVVGIGLNVNNVLPIELCEIATTMKEVLDKETPLALVEEKLLENLALPVSMDDYEARLGYLGAPVNLLVGEEILAAIPQGVTKKGELIALINGEKRIFPSAEVSLRIK